MISYSDNREDVLLARLFRGQANGFYIDVGAYHPTGSSITRHFYDLGWSGLNIEPNPSLHGLYATERPRDVTLEIAVSGEAGELEFWQGLSTDKGLSTLSAEEVERHRQAGFEFERRLVRVTTLAALCEQYASGRTIDFLSVDVEGHERQVLLGADFERFRPRVVIVEATSPNTQEPTHQHWEYLLLAADYVFGAFDGVNRFYIRSEEADTLLPLLAVPVNVFDNYVSYETHVLREKMRLMPAVLASAAIGEGALAVARALDAFYNRHPILGAVAGRLRSLRRSRA